MKQSLEEIKASEKEIKWLKLIALVMVKLCICFSYTRKNSKIRRITEFEIFCSYENSQEGFRMFQGMLKTIQAV